MGYTDLLTNFLDARYWHFTQPNDKRLEETYLAHKKALDDYMNTIADNARLGYTSYSIHDLRMGG